MPGLIAQLRRFLFPSGWAFFWGLLGCACSGLSEEISYSSRVWQTDAGLPDNAVQTLWQTRDGFLWLGTRHGLACFDGMSFTTIDRDDAPALKNEAINTLCETRDGSLWIGTARSGVTRLKDGKFSHYDVRLAGDSFNPVLVMQEAADGRLWLGTRDGLFELQEEKFIRRHREILTVRAICPLPNGDLWVGSSMGLQYVQNGVIRTNYTPDNGLPNRGLRALCQARNGDLWIGSTKGLARFSQGKFTPYTQANDLPNNIVDAIYEDRRGVLWIGTYGGLFRHEHGKFHRELNAQGDSFDQVFGFREDREGNFWMGAKDGLYQLTPKSFVTYTTRHGLKQNNIMSVLENRRGSLWIGTWGGGLHEMKDGQCVAVPNATSRFSSWLVLGLGESADGSLWVGTDYEQGLFHRMSDGTFTRYGGDEKTPLRDNTIRVLHEDRSGNLWVGASSGLNVLREGRFTRYTRTNGLSGNMIRSILETDDQSIWIGTEGGLSRWRGGRFENFTAQNGFTDRTVSALYQDQAGTIWIGTLGGGLYWLKNGRFFSCATRHGLFDHDVFEILEDDEGHLWMSSLRGIFRVAKTDLEKLEMKPNTVVNSISYGSYDGLLSSQCNGVAKPAACKTSDGRLWFATTKGLAVTNPKLHLPKNETIPPVVVVAMIADKKAQNVRFKTPGRDAERGSTTANLSPETVRLAPGRGDIEFHYAALSYRAPEKNRYKYKLAGVDSDWVDAGTRRVASYNHIPPGRYEFQVIGSNNDGLWNPLGANVKFTLQPHYWQTWWFRGGAIFGGVAIFGLTVRQITRRRLQEKLRRLEQQHALEKERARIARDMHDEIGARLTQISFLGGLAKRRLHNPAEAEKQIDTIAQTARDLVSALDEIVWMVDPRKDTLDNLTTFLCRYAGSFFQDTAMNCEFDLPDEVPNLRLETEMRHNLFLAVKEALNNALKHSGGVKVVLRMKLENNRIEITIIDDGKGFAKSTSHLTKATPARVGNGLGNMEQRLESIGGKCRIESEAGQGTRVVFSAPLPVG